MASPSAELEKRRMRDLNVWNSGVTRGSFCALPSMKAKLPSAIRPGFKRAAGCFLAYGRHWH